MKLSEAIVLGSAGTTQAFNQFWNEDKTATCAMGAALLASTLTHLPIKDFSSVWPPLSKREKCPVCETGDIKVLGLILHLNDEHRWPRPRIAEWVRGIEEAEERRTEKVEEEGMRVES